MFVCDWCGGELEGKRGMVTLIVEGAFADAGVLDGWIKDQRRHFHSGTEDDENSCMLQALHLIDCHESAAETLGKIPTATAQKIARLRAKHQRQEAA